MSEFKISRLRFSWVGEWYDQTAYNKDQIVQYEGKAYVCLIPHDSNGFYLDLGAVVPKLLAEQLTVLSNSFSKNSHKQKKGLCSSAD